MAKDYLHVRIESADFDCSEIELHRLSGRERISQLFEFDLEVVNKAQGSLSLDDLAGAEACLVFDRAETEVRRIFGMICRVEDSFATEDAYTVYRFKFVPRAWRMTLVETLEIYMDLNVPDIIRKKLDLIGLGQEGTDYEFNLVEDYPVREFIIQYKETDLTFVQRLAEHWGIFYYIVHENGVDKLVFSDNTGGMRPHVGREVIPYRGRGEEQDIFGLKVTRSLIPQMYVNRDYNYRTPTVELHEQHMLEQGYGGAVIEYGAHFKTPEEGERWARMRAEEHLCTRQIYEGRSNLQTFSPGHTFAIDGHPNDNPALVLLEVEHEHQQAVMGRGSDGDRTYVNTFRGMHSALTYRPPRDTPVPRIYGVTTGIVESDPESSIQKYAKIDKQGRYTIKFLFDTAAPGERKASRPIRRIQAAVGPNYGMHFPLRPGIEVLLVFIDGDPDRPLVVGAVPNPITPTPVDRPVQTKNRLKTESGVIFEIEDGAGA